MTGLVRWRPGWRTAASAAGQGVVEEGEQAVPVVPEPGGAESVGVGHGEAVDGVGIDLGGVADTCGVQGLVELPEGLGRQVAFGMAEMDLGGDPQEEVGPVGAHGAVERGGGGYPAGMGSGGAHRQEPADAVAGHRDRA